MATTASKLASSAMRHAENLARGALDVVRNREFNTAAHICVGVLDREIEVLNSRMKNRDYLSNTEQMLLAHLTELRSEMELKLWGPGEDSSVQRATPDRLGDASR